MTRLKIVVEPHPDGYVAYPLGLNGVVMGEGDTYEAALADVSSAIRFHLDTFGADAFDEDTLVLDAFLAETSGASISTAVTPLQSNRGRRDERGTSQHR